MRRRLSESVRTRRGKGIYAETVAAHGCSRGNRWVRGRIPRNCRWLYGFRSTLTDPEDFTAAVSAAVLFYV